MTARSRSIAIPLALVALAVLPYREVPRLALTGADAPLLIEAARAHSGGLPPALFGPALGHPSLGISFYRPLTALTYTLVDAAVGIRPALHHAVDVALHAGVTVLLYAVARRALAASLPAAVGAIVFALHPAGNEVVPDIARRADLVAALLLLAACASQQHGRPRLALVWAMLAPLGKETGFLAALPLLWWRREAQCRDHPAPWRRGAPARVWAAPLVALLPALLLRILFLRGLGGYAQRPEQPRLAANAVDQLRLLVEPAGWLPVEVGRVVGLAVGAALVALVLRRARPRSLGTAAGLVFVGALAGMAVAGRFGWWHLYMPAVAFGLAVAAAAAGGWPTGAWRQGAALVAASGTALALTGSPLWGRCAEWQAASEVIQRVQRAALAVPQEAAALRIAGLPSRVLTRPGPGLRAHGADVATAHGLAAFLRLHGLAAPRVEALCYLNVPAHTPRAGLVAELGVEGRLRLRISSPGRIALPPAPRSGASSVHSAAERPDAMRGEAVHWLPVAGLRYRWRSPGYPVDIEFFVSDDPAWIERDPLQVWDGTGFRRLGGRAR